MAQTAVSQTNGSRTVPVGDSRVSSASSAPVQRRTSASTCKLDRRSLRSQHALQRTLAQELSAGEDISRLSVATLTEHAGLTRRTFYSHYKDIPDFIEQVERGLLEEIRERVHNFSELTLPDLYKSIDEVEPAPGAVELLQYLADNRELIGSLLGTGGDPAFIEKIIEMVRGEVSQRMQTGIFPGVLKTFFDYYLTSVVASEVGVVQRWFATGCHESPKTMACIMTVIAFVRPGDLYGMPIDINVPKYGLKLFEMNVDNFGLGGARDFETVNATNGVFEQIDSASKQAEEE